MNTQCLYNSPVLSVGRCEHKSDVIVTVERAGDKIHQWTYCKFHLHQVIGRIVEENVQNNISIKPLVW